MAIFKNVFRRLRFWKRTSTEPVVNTDRDITRTLKQYEYFVYKAQHILLWESPSETLCTVAVVNLFFWFFASLEWRFYGIIFTALLMTTLHELWTQEIWPEIRVHEPVPQNVEIDDDSPQDESLIRLSQFIESSQKLIKDYYFWLKNMREKRPGVFCSLMSGVFFSLSIVGRMIPGLVLVYLLVMICLFAPGIWVHVIPEETKKLIVSRLSSFHYAVYHTVADDLPGEEEYLPEATNEELSLLSQFVEPDNEDINSRGSSGTQLSFATSFMPSHDDTSVDSLATFSDLDLNLESAPKTAYDVEDFSDDSSVANDIGIDFQNRHFNGDETSSDEEEKVFTEDLKFTEMTDTGGGANTASNVVATSSQNPIVPDSHHASLTNFLPSNLVGLASAFGQSYLANVLNRGTSGQSNDKSDSNNKNNSSDSLGSEDDFEMISHEDVS